MTLSRRDFLKVAGLVAGSLAVTGCNSVYERIAGSPALPEAVQGSLTHFQLLNRLTFGPRLEERNRLAEIGIASWIEEQLVPASLDDGDCDFRLRRFDTLQLDAASIFDMYGDKLFDDQDRVSAPDELRQATLLRQVYSRRQLYEVMVEFWSDHFHISVDKGDCFYLKTVDDREVIRRHALGNFGELLWASAHSPAMLVYLDNQANQTGAPNENYARELMELHSLSVNGGYTQSDVMQLARCLTGWTVKEHFWRGEFTFDTTHHDNGEKVVLGKPIASSGMGEAESVIERLAVHPSTAHFVTGKLARRFLGDDPPQALLQRAANRFIQTKGDIQTVLRVLLLDGVANMQPLPNKFKRPVNFVTSALRQLNANSNGGKPILDLLARMGQLPFAWPTPDGFPDRNADWMNNLLPRWQFAVALAHNELADTTIDLNLLGLAGQPLEIGLQTLGQLLFGGELTPSVHKILHQSIAPLPEAEQLPLAIAGLLSAPHFQWR